MELNEMLVEILNKHKQTDIVGDSYDRAKSITLTNPKDGNKSITFVKESIINLSDGTKLNTDKGLTIYSLPEGEALNELVELYDLQGNPQGDKTVGEIFNLISLFLNSALIKAEVDKLQ